MELYATTTNGMGNPQTIKVTNISVWLDRECDHTVTTTSLDALLIQYAKTGYMSIYTYGTLQGSLDAFDGVLYTNGAESVVRLTDGNDKIIWSKF